MKKLFCICILICFLLTSCGGGQGDLNVYTPESSSETTISSPIIVMPETTASVIIMPDTSEIVAPTTNTPTSTIAPPDTYESDIVSSDINTSEVLPPETSEPAVSVEAVTTIPYPPETLPPQFITENIPTHIPDIPEELREYVNNYTYTASSDSNINTLSRFVSYFAVCGDYLYHQQMIQNKGQTLLRLRCLNIKTGELTSPCFDPVCTHDTLECDFCFRTPISIQSFGKYIVFYAKKGVSGQQEGFKCYLYNTQTGGLRKEIFNQQDYGNISTYVSHSGNYLYNCGHRLYDNPAVSGTEDKTVYELQFWRHDLSSGKTEIIHTLSDTYRGYNFDMVYGDRIYYRKTYRETGVTVAYSMSLDCTDVREEPYFILAEYYTGSLQWRTYPSGAAYLIQSVDMRNGQVRSIKVDTSNEPGLCVTDKYVYYSITDAQGYSQIWRCDHGLNSHTNLFTFNGELNSFYVYGDYIYCMKTVNQSGKSVTKVMRINMNVGEILYIE